MRRTDDHDDDVHDNTIDEGLLMVTTADVDGKSLWLVLRDRV